MKLQKNRFKATLKAFSAYLTINGYGLPILGFKVALNVV